MQQFVLNFLEQMVQAFERIYELSWPPVKLSKWIDDLWQMATRLAPGPDQYGVDFAAVLGEWIAGSLRWARSCENDETFVAAAFHWRHVLAGALLAWGTRQDQQDRQDQQGDTQRKGIVAGFNLVRDVTVTIRNEEELADVTRALQSRGNLSARLYTVLREPHRHGKHSVDSHIVEALLQALNAVPRRESLGGAPANMAYVLGHLGETVYVSSPYLSDQLPLSGFSDSAYCLRYQPDQETWQTSPLRPGEGYLEDPMVTTVALAAEGGLEADDGESRFRVPEPARALFTGKDPYSPAEHRWKRVRVRLSGGQEALLDRGRRWDAHCWPRVPLFAGVTEQGECLVVKPADVQTLCDWAKGHCRLALIREPGRVKPDGLNLAKNSQLEALSQAGLALHFELDGRMDVTFFREHLDVKTNSRLSAGLNPDELVEVFEQANAGLQGSGCRPPVFRLEPAPSGFLNRFLLATRIRELLGLDWVYVHGNDIDVAVWRPSGEPDTGVRLRDAMLVAKAAVLAALISRLPDDERERASEGTLRNPEPCAKGIVALLAFAREFATWCADQAERQGGAIVEDDVFRALISTGVWSDQKGIGIAVAPVVWPDVARRFPTTGAGDFSSAVVAAEMWR